MKIGQFANRYGINASAVRYYIDKTLISPKRENGQYIFDEACIEQMDRIVRYKQYKFSLEEIEVLAYYEGATNLKDKAVIDEILQIFHDKEKLIYKEIEERKEILEYLKGEISSYQEKAEVAESAHEGVLPIEALEILYCPNCQKHLALRDADIDGTGISKANLRCDCGYHATISDGMILCEGRSEETPFKAFENIDSVLAITDDFSAEYRNLMEKAHLWMYQQITAKGREFDYCLAGPFSYNFLLKHMKALPEDVIYIIADVSVKKLEKLQKYFSEMNRKIIFVAGEIDKLPIKGKSVDLYIDDFSSNNYTFTYNKDLFKSIGPLMGKRGMVVGQFIDYSHAPKSLENFKIDHEDFKPELMKKKIIYKAFADAGMKITEEINCGSTTGQQQHFARHVSGENVTVVAYSAVKE